MGAARNRAADVQARASAARTNPYVQRVIEDPELRDNVMVAFENARTAYSRISNEKKPAKALMENKKLHKELRSSADALREATKALRAGPAKPRKRSGGGLGRKLLVLAAGAGLAVAVSGDLRSKILDALFGKEEEFEYTSTATS